MILFLLLWLEWPTPPAPNAFTHVGPDKEVAATLDLINTATNRQPIVFSEWKPSEADLKRERRVLEWFAKLGDGYRGNADYGNESLTFFEYRTEGTNVVSIRLGLRPDGMVVWKKEVE